MYSVVLVPRIDCILSLETSVVKTVALYPMMLDNRIKQQVNGVRRVPSICTGSIVAALALLLDSIGPLPQEPNDHQR